MVLTILVGMSFAVFGVPFLAVEVLKIDLPKAALSRVCGATYFGALFGNALIPLILRKIKSKFGLNEGATE